VSLSSPTFTLDDDKDTATQDRLNELADDTLHGVLAEGAEIGGALGGSFYRVSWDKEVVPDKPFLTCVHADAALPTFRWGRLVAVTFWTVMKREGQQVWRLLERHELDSQRVGIIQYGLYLGSEANLGRVIPLTDIEQTKPLAEPGMLTNGNEMSTESPGLACVYVPNQRPQRRWRNDPIGYSLGRSTLDGVEHLMDALDETYSSWMRDIRLGKARVFVARSVLDEHGPGKGSTFDADQEVFAPLNLLQARDGGGTGLPIQAEQFKIRYEEHSATADKLTEVILRTAGFSTQTFGMDSSGAKASNLTATEVQAHERRSYMTRDRQIRLFNPQIQAIMEKLLAVDKAMFGSDVTPQRPTVTFTDSVQDSQITLAQTAQALRTAEAASTKTLVQMQHPDWPDDQIEAEVALIADERASSVPDPFGHPPVDPGATDGPAGTVQQ